MIHRSDVICRFKKEPHFGGLEGSNVAALFFFEKSRFLKRKIKTFFRKCHTIVFPSFLVLNNGTTNRFI